MVRTQATAIGDIVTLKSGGPQMTVESVEPALPGAVTKGISAAAGMLCCIWHDASGLIQSRHFWPHTLVPVETDKPVQRDPPLAALNEPDEQHVN